MNKITTDVAELLSKLRCKKPLIHNITNYVTVNDCANIILAVGASPIMADDMEEAADITAISSSLVINIGTLNRRTVESMICSGKRANALGIPVVFDPVGAGASALRNNTTETILSEVKIGVLRGNMSEISFIAGLGANTKGVDASDKDNKNDGVAIASSVARKLGCVVAITGAVDIISDGKRVAKISNGHKMLSNVTGTGCMATALAGAFCGASNDNFTAAVAGVVSMGIAGEIAFEKAGENGTGSFHIAIVDAISKLAQIDILERAKINEA
ncbi:MAG TPA: hydroxyethylthiazole kinase [Ruminiclostridium sp.]|nr:hydroxyethylthiazole kinase [Ruminiclostridium sp.]